jgi:uncharacterized membrane protein YfcA
MSATAQLVYGAIALILGGFVKGSLGVGLPMVAVPLLSLMLPGHEAIAIMVVPVLASNSWQAWESGVRREEIRRFMPLIITLVIATVATARMTLSLSDRTLTAMIALAVLVAVALMVWQPVLNVAPASERRWGAAVGLLSGLMGGVSSLTGPLILSYLMAIRLPRDTFVGTISVIYLAAAVPLYVAMFWHGKIGLEDVAWSTAALAPVWVGLTAGRACRHRLSERAFRGVLQAFLVAVCLALLLR